MTKVLFEIFVAVKKYWINVTALMFSIAALVFAFFLPMRETVRITALEWTITVLSVLVAVSTIYQGATAFVMSNGAKRKMREIASEKLNETKSEMLIRIEDYKKEVEASIGALTESTVSAFLVRRNALNMMLAKAISADDFNSIIHYLSEYIVFLVLYERVDPTKIGSDDIEVVNSAFEKTKELIENKKVLSCEETWRFPLIYKLSGFLGQYDTENKIFQSSMVMFHLADRFGYVKHHTYNNGDRGSSQQEGE